MAASIARKATPLALAAAAAATGGWIAQRWSASAAAAAPKTAKAVCVLAPDGGSGVAGTVWFSQEPGKPTLVKAHITGLSDGLHGFHIHEFGNLTQGCTTAGGHYNPFSRPHGGAEDADRHVGDLGNVKSKGKVAEFELVASQIHLTGQYSVVGRSCVVHANEDDLGKGKFDDSKTTGHAGARQACGVIGIDKV